MTDRVVRPTPGEVLPRLSGFCLAESTGASLGETASAVPTALEVPLDTSPGPSFMPPAQMPTSAGATGCPSHARNKGTPEPRPRTRQS